MTSAPKIDGDTRDPEECERSSIEDKEENVVDEVVVPRLHAVRLHHLAHLGLLLQHQDEDINRQLCNQYEMKNSAKEEDQITWRFIAMG